MNRTTLHISNLPRDVVEKELDDLFYKFGRITRIDLVKKRDAKTAFAFVAFTDYRDAEDAKRGRDGVLFGGGRIRVEFAKDNEHRRDIESGNLGRRKHEAEKRMDRSRGGNNSKDDKKTAANSTNGSANSSSNPANGIPVRSAYGIHITGFPKDTKWRAVKQHVITIAGGSVDVCYTDIPCGSQHAVMEFILEEHANIAVEKMHGCEFKGVILSAVRRPSKALSSGTRAGREGGGLKSPSASTSITSSSTDTNTNITCSGASAVESDHDVRKESRSRSRSRSRDRGEQSQSIISPNATEAAAMLKKIQNAMKARDQTEAGAMSIATVVDAIDK